MAGVKLSQIASGGAINTSTDKVVGVRSGTTDVLLDLSALGVAGSSGQLQYNNSGALGGTAGGIYASSGNLFTITAQADADVPLSLKQHSGTQSGNLFQVLNSSNTPLFQILSTGSTYIGSGQTDGGTGALLSVSTGIYTPGFIWASQGLRFSSANQVVPGTDVANTVLLTGAGGLQFITGGGFMRYYSSVGFTVFQNDSTTYGTMNLGTVLGGTDLALMPGASSGNNAVNIKNDVGTTLVSFSRNNGVLWSASVVFTPGNTYDIGIIDSNNSARNIDAQSQMSSPLMWGRLIDNNAGVAYTVVVEHGSNNNAGVNGDGAGIAFRQKSSTTASRNVANIQGLWASATDASRKGRLTLNATDASGSRECIRCETDGSNPLFSAFGVTAVVQQTGEVIAGLQSLGFFASGVLPLSGYSAVTNAQTGTTYTLAASDTGKVVTLSNASAITLTLPNSLPAGFVCTVVQKGAGQVTFSAAAGATLNNAHTQTKTFGQYAICTLYVDANSGGSSAIYYLAGDTA